MKKTAPQIIRPRKPLQHVGRAYHNEAPEPDPREPRRGPGRPPSDTPSNRIQVSINISTEHRKRLTAIAARMGKSMSGVVEQGIDLMVKKQESDFLKG